MSFQPRHLTKSIFIFIFCGIILAAMLVIWLLVGDCDLLGQHWLLPMGGLICFSNKISTQADATKIFNLYQTQIIFWRPDLNTADKFWTDFCAGMTDKNIIIRDIELHFNPLIIAPVGGVIFVAFIVFFILKITHKIEYNVLPFLLTVCIASCAYIFSGLIPFVTQKGHGEAAQWAVILLILGRILLSVAVGAGVFFLTNFIVNNAIANSEISEQALKDNANDIRESNI